MLSEDKAKSIRGVQGVLRASSCGGCLPFDIVRESGVHASRILYIDKESLDFDAVR